MLLNITTNLADVRRQLSGLEKQVNFAASQALNATAHEVRKAGGRRRYDLARLKPEKFRSQAEAVRKTVAYAMAPIVR